MLNIGLYQFARNILGNFNCFGDSSALCDQSLQIIACRQITAFIQRLNMNGNDYFAHLFPFDSNTPDGNQLYHQVQMIPRKKIPEG